MDKIFINGRVHALDDKASEYEAAGVCGERIVALGEESEIRKQASSRTELIDLGGGDLFPGLIDSHNHLMIYAYLLDGINLAPPTAGSVGDVVDLVQADAAQKPPSEWIRGSRFAEYFLAENRYPTRDDLDPVSPDNPVILYHTSFHACVLNSKALEELGLNEETPVPEGGLIERDPNTGRLSGVFHDAAMVGLVFNVLFVKDLQAMSTSQQVAMCSRAMDKFAELGVVAVADALVVPVSLTIYQETLAAGKASVRVYTMPEINYSQELMASGLKTGFGNDWLKIGPIKIFEDGGMSNRTAAVKTPYLCPPYGRGLKVHSREQMIAAATKCHNLGFQVAVHSQGDAGLEDTLDAFEAVLGPRSDNPLRHRIEHAGCLYPELLARAAAMNICISSQPVFFSFLGDGWVEAFGREIADTLYPYRSMLNAGIHLGGSSDCPVSPPDPRLSLAGAVLRQTASGEVLGPNEALTMDEALRMYTSGSAWLSFEENIAGTVEIGKRADFTVFEKDPRRIPPEEVIDLTIKMTVVGGVPVFVA